MSHRGRVALALLTMYIAWGTTYVGIAYAIETMPDLLAMGLRFLAAGTLQFAVVGFTSGFAQFRVSRSQFRNASFLGVIMLAVGLGTVSRAEHAVPLGVCALIIASTPVWTALLRLLSRDRPSWVTMAGVALGLAGLAVILEPGKTVPRAGAEHLNLTMWMLILVASNLLWSIGSFITPRVDVPVTSTVLTTYEMFAAGFALLVTGLLDGQRITAMAHATARSWAGWSYLVIVGSVVGYTTYNWLLSNAPISLVSTYSYVNPLVAAGLGAVLFGEKITSQMALGGLLVLGSVAAVAAGERLRPILPSSETV